MLIGVVSSATEAEDPSSRSSVKSAVVSPLNIFGAKVVPSNTPDVANNSSEVKKVKDKS